MEYKKKRGSFETVMIIIIVVLLILIAITSALLILRPLIGDRSEKLVVNRKLTLGKRYLSELDYERAVTEFSEVVRIDEKNTEAYVGLGDAYTGLGKWSAAVENYDTALDTMRDSAGIASADRPEGSTTSAWEDSGHTREDILAEAGLPDDEYMKGDDLYLIAVLVFPEDFAEQSDNASLAGEDITKTAKEIFAIVEDRNHAIQKDLEEIRAKGEDESKYKDYIDWVTAHGTETDQETEEKGQQENDPNAQEEQAGQTDWYAYIRDHFVKDRGYVSLEPASRQIGVNDIGNGTWNLRTGTVSAQIADLDDDGIEECAVFYFDDKYTYGTGTDLVTDIPQTTLYITLLTADEKGEVIEKESRQIFFDDGTGFRDVVGGIMEFEGRKYIYIECNSFTYFANVTGFLYTFFTYDGQSFRPEFAVGKTGGGSMALEYSIIRSDEGGHFTGDRVCTDGSPWYWADGSYSKTLLCVDDAWDMEHDRSDYDTSIMMDSFDRQAAMTLGLENVTGISPETITLENGGGTNGVDPQYPTYRNSDLFTQAFHYNCNGSGNYESRSITITVEDNTNLQQTIEGGE